MQITPVEMNTLVNYGSAIKSLERDGDLVTVGAHGILWGSEKAADLVGDWFVRETNFGARKGMGVDTMLHHGMPLSPALREYAGLLLPPTVKAEVDEHGLLVATVLDLRNTYQQKIYELCESGALSWSSGANPMAVRRKNSAKSGQIEQWPIMEFSFTPTPCEARMGGIIELKSLLLPETETPSFVKAVRVLTDLTPKPEVKAEYLGEWVESDMTTAALSRLTDALMYRVVAPALAPTVDAVLSGSIALPTQERMARVEAAFGEFTTIAVGFIRQLMGNEAVEGPEDAAKAIRDIYPDPAACKSIEILEAGSRAELRFLDHSQKVLAAEGEFYKRFSGWLEVRESSRKAGRVLSAENHAHFSTYADTLDGIAKGMREKLDQYKPAAKDEPAEAKSADEVNAQIHEQRLRFEATRARLNGVPV